MYYSILKIDSSFQCLTENTKKGIWRPASKALVLNWNIKQEDFEASNQFWDQFKIVDLSFSND